jgi:hypothetical protein
MFYARTREGYELPIVDVTHPRFAVADDTATLDRLREAYFREHRQRRFIPRFLLRFLIRQLAKKSRLAATLFNPGAAYLDSISTYVMKLGADNLAPPFDTQADRRFATSSHVALLRLRMQQVATLLAGGIARDPAFAGSAPLHLINIAGGPALDSINGLLLLKAERPDLLRRAITIHVLDRNPDGVVFGAHALEVLKGEGGPLKDIDVSLAHRDYDWDHPAELKRRMQDWTAAGALIIASSEGGLFEYGSDQAIMDNLHILHEGARFVAGSVTNGDAIRRQMIAMSHFKVIPRGPYRIYTACRSRPLLDRRSSDRTGQRTGASAPLLAGCPLTDCEKAGTKTSSNISPQLTGHTHGP